MSISTEIILKRRIEAQEARYKEMLAAAEFEARVAAKLAIESFAMIGDTCESCIFHNINECYDFHMRKYHNDCSSPWFRLKQAHIEVEEEMDG